MVLRRRNNPKLLALGALRPELDLSMVPPNSPSMADRNPSPRLLHRRVDGLPLDLLPPVEKSFLDLAGFRDGSWCAALGADLVEYFEYGSVFALDGGSCG